MRTAHLLLLAVLLFLATGCPRTTIHTRAGGEISGDVERSDEQYVYIAVDEPTSRSELSTLVRDAEPRRGPGRVRPDDKRLFRIDRRRIADIDYPGNVMGTIGVSVALMGAGLMSYGIVRAAECGNHGLCGFFHITMTAPGAGMVIAGAIPTGIGWGIYRGQKSKADPGFDEIPVDATFPGIAEVRVLPFASPTQKGANVGLSTVVAW